MNEIIVLRKLSKDQLARVDELKKIFGVGTRSKAVKKLIDGGKL